MANSAKWEKRRFVLKKIGLVEVVSEVQDMILKYIFQYRGKEIRKDKKTSGGA